MSPFILSAVLLVAAALLLAVSGLSQQLGRRQVLQRLESGKDEELSYLLHDLERARLTRRASGLDPEVRLLLDRLGWRLPRQRALFMVIQFGFPLLLACLALLAHGLPGEAAASPWVTVLFSLGIGYLIPKRVLASAAARRQARLAMEVSTAIPLLRILFEVGMAVEQALRVLAEEGREILPEMSGELRQALQRVDAGLELGAELRRIASLVEVDEITDCVVILDQLIRQGGGAMASLLALKQLMDDRRMTNLQERVSKLSAKMSVVMVAFLFPALLVVLAGPGFIAIVRALGEMG